MLKWNELCHFFPLQSVKLFPAFSWIRIKQSISYGMIGDLFALPIKLNFTSKPLAEHANVKDLS